MINKKAQTNKVFVYLLSIIIILFVGFLVTKFIMTFSSNIEGRAETVIYDNLRDDYKTVYRTYGAEKFYNYKLSSQSEYICFINSIDCIGSIPELNDASKENLNISVKSGHNVALFTKDDIINSQNIGKFQVANGCLCIKPIQGKISLIFRNEQNKVIISENK